MMHSSRPLASPEMRSSVLPFERFQGSGNPLLLPAPLTCVAAFASQLLGFSVIPLAAAFWDLREGDTVLELAVKAKRGRLGNTADPATMRRLLLRLIALLPFSPRQRQTRLQQARSASACAFVLPF